jgi:hypothetical protein
MKAHKSAGTKKIPALALEGYTGIFLPAHCNHNFIHQPILGSIILVNQ